MLGKLLYQIKNYQNQRKHVPDDYPFIMYPEEKILLKKHLENASNFLEFGLGGSTIFSLIHSKVNIISVDTNQKWIGFMKKYKIIKNHIGKRLKIHFIDIGPTKQWGYPVDNSQEERFPDFSAKIFSLEDPAKFDLILIDGRFRVACTLQSILHCHQNKNLKILIHDYSLRNQYQEVEKYLNLIEKTKTLYCFQVKTDLNIEALQESYLKYQYIQD